MAVTPVDYRIHEAIPSDKDSLYKIKVIKPIKILINHFGNCFIFVFISCEKVIPNVLATDIEYTVEALWLE